MGIRKKPLCLKAHHMVVMLSYMYYSCGPGPGIVYTHTTRIRTTPLPTLSMPHQQHAHAHTLSRLPHAAPKLLHTAAAPADWARPARAAGTHTMAASS